MTASGASEAMGGEAEAMRATLGDLITGQALIQERLERLVKLNEQMWDHHLHFCGELISKIATTERELFDSQSELGRQLSALQGEAGEEPSV